MNCLTPKENFEHMHHLKYRKNIARFRVSSHDLEIERGRHTRNPLPPELRTCQQCSMGETEDEIHAFLVCPKYETTRQSLLSRVTEYETNFGSLSPLQKLKFCLECTEQSILILLGKHITNINTNR